MLFLWPHWTIVHVSVSTACSSCCRSRLATESVLSTRFEQKVKNWYYKRPKLGLSIWRLDSFINVWEVQWPRKSLESKCCSSASCKDSSKASWLTGRKPQGSPRTHLPAGLETLMEIQQGARKWRQREWFPPFALQSCPEQAASKWVE